MRLYQVDDGGMSKCLAQMVHEWREEVATRTGVPADMLIVKPHKTENEIYADRLAVLKRLRREKALEADND
jgi:hypothetical protein